MKQQTAVEWLLDRIEDVDNSPEIWELIKYKAKEMEKQQMIDFSMRAYQDVSNLMNVPFNQISENRLNFENVFNETFKK
jgi:hypothetical protein